MRSYFSIGVVAVISLFVVRPVFSQPANLPDVITSSVGDLRLERLASLEFPWGIALLPDGRMLITEKPGRLRIFANGELSEAVGGVPKVVYRGAGRDQGGLLDVEIDPGFADNGYVYISYSEAAEQQSPDLADIDDFRFGRVDPTDNIVRGGLVARGKLEGNQLRDVKVIWRQSPKTMGRGHFGNRLVFAPDGKLFITSGDRMRFGPAQSLGSNLGKVLRINPDGSVPTDNPFANREGARDDIWSYGHRNVLSAAIEPESGGLWVLEMGPLGGDELNLIQPGRNYGWPLVSNGDHYGRPSIPTSLMTIAGHLTSKAYEAPVRSWTPVISPSGAMFYTGSMFAPWRGNLFAGGLSSRAVIRLKLEEGKVAIEERIDMKRRIRDIAQAADGALLVLVDAREGELLRITPADRQSP